MNILKNKCDTENLEGEELIKNNKLMKEQNKYLEYSKAKEIANYFMLFKKYDRKENYTYKIMAHSILQETFPITLEREKRIIEQSMDILLREYNIKIDI